VGQRQDRIHGVEASGSPVSCRRIATRRLVTAELGNQRVAATENGTETDFVLDRAASDGTVMQETSGSSTTTYTHGLGPISRETASGISYLLTDGQGSVRLETDASGNVIKNHTYDAYGIEQGTPDLSGNRFRYTGQWSDGSGPVFLRARFYDPQTGTFLSVDPKATASSPYAYCGDNPLSATDPSGADWNPFGWVSNFLFGSGTSAQQSAAASTYFSPGAWVGSFGWSLEVWKHPKLTAVSFGIGAATGAALYCGADLLGAAGADQAGTLITRDGVDAVAEHLGRFGDTPYNSAMLDRPESSVGSRVTGADESFFNHELTEKDLMDSGMPYQDAHAGALEAHGATEYDLYHSDVIRSMPEWFNSSWFEYWNIPK
jgi:RHS repeat-associated protein